jgi:hypothetical protein
MVSLLFANFFTFVFTFILFGIEIITRNYRGKISNNIYISDTLSCKYNKVRKTIAQRVSFGTL